MPTPTRSARSSASPDRPGRGPRLRDQLRPIFATQSDERAARLLNAIIGQAPVTPRLTDHDGYSWHMYYFAPAASVAEHLAVDGGMALARVVAAGERERRRAASD